MEIDKSNFRDKYEDGEILDGTKIPGWEKANEVLSIVFG